MPKISNSKLQIPRVNRQECTNNKNSKNSPDDKTALELLSGLKAESIPPPDTDFIKRVLENSRRAKSKKNDPPRPPNAFFLFRNALHSHLSALNLKVPQVSAAAGELWNNASEEMKSKYIKLQEVAKFLHLEMHPGYVYRPRKNFTPSPSNKLNVDEKSSEKKPTSNNPATPSSPDSFSSLISEPPSPTKFVDSGLAQLSTTQCSKIEVENLQLRRPSLPKPLVHYNEDLYVTKDKSSRDLFTSEHNEPSQKLMEFHQESTQPQPTRLVRHLPPVQDQIMRYHDLNNNVIHNQRQHRFATSQQLNQIDPVLITTLTSFTAFPVPHVNSVTSVETSNNFTMTFENRAIPNSPNLNFVAPHNMITNGFDVRNNTVMPQPTIVAPYQYLPARYGLVGDPGNDLFSDWVDWDHQYTEDTF
ncbi:9865_t:CDS:1 [Funneliformis caledonium]|uniref:9865_t:CDS:1 n=1 Tax=Funneliformis caledonium TaxID=1117310 RepID=A0A9N9G555_9GLOM|nr:9865_t:CDS:1 [Funneliformis caledonium]